MAGMSDSEGQRSDNNLDLEGLVTITDPTLHTGYLILRPTLIINLIYNSTYHLDISCTEQGTVF